ncbi:hypothetical protein PsorP6_015167 [Peronosclerospora sorghi]|uniref:Uncharacterized protein n=1 Tax=Peronosclerospora sorghi TaxID=230839 RepID=A0ACC0VVT9_9STRA|nr:hypothetical protein PsorP6_015167 [Peronosclerospora sorghi]
MSNPWARAMEDDYSAWCVKLCRPNDARQHAGWPCGLLIIPKTSVGHHSSSTGSAAKAYEHELPQNTFRHQKDSSFILPFASPCVMAAPPMELERTPLPQGASVCVTHTLPPRVLKKRRVRSKTHDGCCTDEMAMARTTSCSSEWRHLTAMHHIHSLLNRPEQEPIRTSRATASAHSDDTEAATPAACASSSSSLMFVLARPKLETSKSDGLATVLPSERRQVGQLRHEQVQTTTWGTPLRHAEELSKSEKVCSAHETWTEHYPENLERKNTRWSLSSDAPNDALEAHTVTSPSTAFSSSGIISEDALLPVAQCAKRQLQALSKHHKWTGRWKSLTWSKSKVESFESTSKAKDQYSIVVKMTLPCSLREIVGVFSTDKTAEFHRSMEAIFGDQYVYGVNVHTSDCASLDAKAEAALSSTLRASEPFSSARQARESSHVTMTPLHTATLKVNAITLMQKHHLVWKQRNMKFLDYLEEEIETRSVTRVMQTLDVQDNDPEHLPSVTMYPTSAGNHLDFHAKQQHQHEIDVHRDLQGIFAGYVIQEHLNEQFTRFFFYATHRRHQRGQKRIARSAVQLLRSMVKKVCLLETVILRRRLGRYLSFRFPVCPDEAAMATYCATCNIPFNMLRKKYFCTLCGHYTCRKCSEMHEVEKSIGMVEKHRVCVPCVRRVGYRAFNTCVSLTEINCKAEGDDYDPPIMDDLASNELEHVTLDLFKQSGDVTGSAHDSWNEEKKMQAFDAQREVERTAHLKHHLAVQRRRQQHLQLSIEDLSQWVPGPILDNPNTPKESISLLDSFRTSISSTSS